MGSIDIYWKNMIKSITTVEERNQFDGSLIYKDNQFEKKTKRTDYLANRKTNDQKLWFVNQDDRSIKKEYREDRVCPICSSNEFLLLFNKDGFNHVKCSDCKFVFVSPILSDEALLKYYESEDSWTKVMLSDEEKKVNRIMYSFVLSFLEKEINKENKKLLDVGSGSGYFLETAKEKGWEVKGIELNKDMLSLSNKNGLNVSNKPISYYIKTKERFDVVTSWYVLEHIKNMKEFISEIEQVVENGGILFLGVPQLDALANRLYFKESPTFAGYSHINFFNRDSLNKFIESFGFELIAQETHITQISNIKKYFNRVGVSQNSGIGDLLSDITPEYIHSNFLGSNLVSVYRKK